MRFIILIGTAAGLLAGCSHFGFGQAPTAQDKVFCGRQCLSNGEQCSAFFARKNEERRLDFEQAKENFWICLKKYSSAKTPAENPCIAPAPEPELFDSCGEQLDACMEQCGTTLDEVAELVRQPDTPAPSAPMEPGADPE